MVAAIDLTVTTGGQDSIGAIERLAIDWLSGHARTAGVVFDKQLFAIEAKADGRAIGALIGSTNQSWLHVALLSVDPTRRRNGVGRALLSRAEEIARGRGCIGAWLDTYDFQGPDYYPRFGYEVFGRIDDMPPGHTRFFYTKRL